MGSMWGPGKVTIDIGALWNSERPAMTQDVIFAMWCWSGSLDKIVALDALILANPRNYFKLNQFE